MSLVKAPTSSLTAIELITKKLWYRTKASVKRCFRRGVLETSTSRSSPITNLPQELVDAIISHLIHDTHTLRACSTTCYSWYIAAVPHLHHSLTTDRPIHPGEERYLWPNPLQKSYNLGLLPLVKRFRIHLYDYRHKLTPERLCGRTLRYFSALTNLQELGIDLFDIPSFTPNVQQYFGHLAPTLRLLALKDPKGSWRQILYFIGLFPNLQDFKLLYSMPTKEQDGTADPDLVPLSVPPLRGWLTLGYLVGDGLVRDMISLFGGLRFRSMDLFGVECVRLLLDACAETLETLRLHPTDMYADDGSAGERFNLSRNKTLRTLETNADSIVHASDAASIFFQTVLSTIASSLPLDIVVIYRNVDLNFFVSPRAEFEYASPRRSAKCVADHRKRFKVFSEMYGAREFRLVLCANVPNCIAKRAMRVLKRVVEAERTSGGLDYLLHEPLIISELRAPSNCLAEDHTSVRGCSIFVSAL